MPMTAAERQKRYRKRLKEAHQRLAGERDMLVCTLRDSYYASGINLLRLHDDDAAHAALRAFTDRVRNGLDMMQIMEAAGKAAALELYEREFARRMAPRQRRVIYLRKVNGSGREDR